MSETIREKLNRIDHKCLDENLIFHDLRSLFEATAPRLSPQDKEEIKKVIQNTDDAETIAAVLQAKAMDDKNESLEEELVDAPQEVIDELLEILENHGFILDNTFEENPGKTMIMGDVHIQVINPDSFIEDSGEIDVQDELSKYVTQDLIDEIHELDQESNCPITWNFGINNDGQVTGGLDIMKQWVEESLQERVYSERYSVRAYYDDNYRGLADSFNSDDFDEIRDKAHEFLSDGSYITVNDYETGKFFKLTPDEYFYGFEGEGIQPYMFNESLKEAYKHLNNKEKQAYIDIINNPEECEDIDDLKDIVHEIFFYDRALFAMMNRFPKNASFEELKANKIAILKDSMFDESLKEDILSDRTYNNLVNKSKKTYTVGVYSDLKGPGFHYEINTEHGVYTKVPDGEGFIAHWFLQGLPQESEEDMERIANNIINKYNCKEVPLDEYKQIVNESLKEDTVKQNGKWVNKGKEGTHGKFKTKKAADAQRKAMFANGYKSESLNEALEAPYFKAFITNLGKYNEGELVGDWVEFPIDEDDFTQVLESIGIGDTDDFGAPYEEWFVSDYECNLPGFDWQELGEYPSYESLQEYGELVNSIDDLEAVSNALEVTGNLQDAIDGIDNGSIMFYRGVNDNSDLGYMWVDEVYGGAENLDKDTLERYFDYEQLGRDLSFDSYENDEGEDISAGEYWCGDENASDAEIGEAFVDAVGIDGVSDISSYFDYEQFGRDLTFDGFTFTSDGCVLQESLKKNGKLLKEDYQHKDDEWGDPYTYKEVERELKSITNDFTDEDGNIRCYWEQEKEYGKQILKDYYEIVEVSDGRTGSGEDMSWVISYARPKEN